MPRILSWAFKVAATLLLLVGGSARPLAGGRATFHVGGPAIVGTLAGLVHRASRCAAADVSRLASTQLRAQRELDGADSAKGRASRRLKMIASTDHLDSVGEASGGALEGEDCSLQFVAECMLPTARGLFQMRSYRWVDGDGQVLMEPMAIFKGDFANKRGPTLVRVHDQCFTSEVFGSQRCDCKDQLDLALDTVQKQGGAILYLRQEGRGIGLANKVAAYHLQDTEGLDTVDANTALGFPADMRSYKMVPHMLKNLQLSKITLMTNNPRKTKSLRDLGVDVVGTKAILAVPNEHNMAYLSTKANRMNHMYSVEEDAHALQPLQPLRGGSEAVEAEEAPEGQSSEPEVIVEKGARAEEIVRRSARWVFGRESVERAIEDMKTGKPVVVVDDEDRENEGDLIVAAEMATKDNIAFFVRYTSGVICVGIEEDRLDELELPQMVSYNEDPKATAFTITVDAKDGVSTGISAEDRALTLRRLADASSVAGDFVRPGHILPLKARKGGVMVRQGHTEASVDLAKLAGLAPAGVLCEITTEDSVDMARLPELKVFAEKHDLTLTSIEDIVMYRFEQEHSK